MRLRLAAALLLFFSVVAHAQTKIDLATQTKGTLPGLAAKADDSAVVHKTGDESIQGVKTFENGIRFGTGIANDTTTGTTNKLLAKFDAAGKLVKAGTSDTAVPVYVVVSGGATSGSAFIALSGQATCTFDGAATAQHYVVASTSTAGNCHDAGASLPTDVWVIGQVSATIASGDGVVNLLSGQMKSAASTGGCTAGTPASPSDAGSDGDCKFDTNYQYRYVGAASRWHRVAWDSTWLLNAVQPTFTPDGRAIGTGGTITMATATSGAKICFTTNGSPPAATTPGTCDGGSTEYTTAISEATQRVRAIATKAGLTNSSEKSAYYTVGTPSFSPASGSTIASGATVTVTCPSGMPTPTVYTTQDGNDPTTSSTAGATPSVTASPLKAMCAATSYPNSVVGTATYTISGGSGRGAATVTENFDSGYTTASVLGSGSGDAGKWNYLEDINGGIRVKGTTDLQIFGLTSSHGAAMWKSSVNSAPNDQWVSLDLVVYSTGWTSSYTIGVECRGSGLNATRKYYYVEAAAASGTNTFMGKYVDGVHTSLGSAAVTWNIGDVLSMECVGTSLTAYKNSTAITGLSAISDSSIAAGQPGVVGKGSETVIHGDNFKWGPYN
ncbi:MAG TPA: chitobiase/beta-hexosaminidase C-terminal domain-containing protein [Terriglobales bacterium]|nr:chitobiase/beta-hexosaminidase C-terminal domain-containing protein [Terriglobales bacterium]